MLGIVLENEAVEDTQLEKVLLHYLDTPYFQNNPWYTSLWKRLYAGTGDSSVLFLMRMKGVGCLSSWLYLQLFEHFTEKKCEVCAQSILNEGIKAKAYPVEDLEKKVSTGGVRVDFLSHKLEVPERVFVLRKEWQKKTAIGYRKESLRLEGREVSFIEYKVHRYIARKRKRIEEETEKGLNEVSLLFGSLKDSPKKRSKPSTQEDSSETSLFKETSLVKETSLFKETSQIKDTSLVKENRESIDYLGIDEEIDLPLAFPAASTPPHTKTEDKEGEKEDKEDME
ncbi:hypothetical protein NECID01_2053, partial [Nematocida sp. AWRm77]